mgnify:CR=1 FL=1
MPLILSPALRRAIPAATIRRAITHDAGELLTLQHAWWAKQALASGTVTPAPLRQTTRDVRAWVLDWRTVVVRSGSRIVATARARRSGDAWLITGLMTAPDITDSCVADELLDVMEQEAPRDTIRFIVVTAANIPGNDELYARAGYEPAELPAAIKLACGTEKREGVVALEKPRR